MESSGTSLAGCGRLGAHRYHQKEASGSACQGSFDMFDVLNSWYAHGRLYTWLIHPHRKAATRGWGDSPFWLLRGSGTAHRNQHMLRS